MHVDSKNFRDALAYTYANGLSEKVMFNMMKNLSMNPKDLENPSYISDSLMTWMGEIIENHKEIGLYGLDDNS